MFTGLIHTCGTLSSVTSRGNGVQLAVDLQNLRPFPDIGASIAVNGACLTVTAIEGATALFDAVEETVARTTLRNLRPGDRVNLEPALRIGDPLDGHLVLGHVDTTASILSIRPHPESRVFRIELPASLRPFVASKGSIAVDGISLTVVEADETDFTLSIIPHTLNHTTLADRKPGDLVNLEADLLARYILRQQTKSPGLTEGALRQAGFS